LSPGRHTDLNVEFTLDLHGRTQSLSAELLVTRVGDGVLVSTRKPIIVNAEPFGLAAGVEALREVAGLSRISHAVPVSFVVEFHQD
jgi:hypothetical protein